MGAGLLSLLKLPTRGTYHAPHATSRVGASVSICRRNHSVFPLSRFARMQIRDDACLSAGSPLTCTAVWRKHGSIRLSVWMVRCGGHETAASQTIGKVANTSYHTPTSLIRIGFNQGYVSQESSITAYHTLLFPLVQPPCAPLTDQHWSIRLTRHCGIRLQAQGHLLDPPVFDTDSPDKLSTNRHIDS